MELYEAMTTAGATRRFLTDPVSDETLLRVLDAARYAPSGGNRQGWRVIVIRDVQTRRALRDLYQEPWGEYVARWYPLPLGAEIPLKLQRSNEFAAHLDDAPVHLLVCVQRSALNVTDPNANPSITGGASVYPFVQNLLLACHAEGLGTVLTTLLGTREAQVRQLLALPDDYAFAAHVPIGYPAPGAKVTKLKRLPVTAFAVCEKFGGAPFGG